LEALVVAKSGMKSDQPSPESSMVVSKKWCVIFELIEAGQYKRAAGMLHDLVRTPSSEELSEDGDYHILSAAIQICLACRQCQEELEWHQMAYQETLIRAGELKGQLEALLDEIVEIPPTASASVETTPSAPSQITQELSEWWGRLRAAWAALAGEQATQYSPSELPLVGLEAPTDAAGDMSKSPACVQEKAISPHNHIAHQSKLSTQSFESSTSIQPKKDTVVVLSGAPSLVVFCLGPFRVFQNEQLIPSWNGQKSQGIFKYLISVEGKPVAKDVLMDIFWPEANLASARRNLHQAIYSLRQTLRRIQPDYSHVLFESDTYFLNPEMDIWCDFMEFEQRWKAGKRCKARNNVADAVIEFGIAESLYIGDFLEEDLYDEWPKMKREYLRVSYFDLTDTLIEYHLSRSEFTAASAICRKVLARDNFREQVHRFLIECYLAQGQRHLALQQYHLCIKMLRDELDLEPTEATLALYRRIMMAE
jgi:DNA-binding SARP family transcriptional activator